MRNPCLIHVANAMGDTGIRLAANGGLLARLRMESFVDAQLSPGHPGPIEHRMTDGHTDN